MQTKSNEKYHNLLMMLKFEYYMIFTSQISLLVSSLHCYLRNRNIISCLDCYHPHSYLCFTQAQSCLSLWGLKNTAASEILLKGKSGHVDPYSKPSNQFSFHLDKAKSSRITQAPSPLWVTVFPIAIHLRNTLPLDVWTTLPFPPQAITQIYLWEPSGHPI